MLVKVSASDRAYSSDGISVASLLDGDLFTDSFEHSRSRSEARVYACDYPCIAVALAWSERGQLYVDAIWGGTTCPMWRMASDRKSDQSKVFDVAVYGSSLIEFHHESSVSPTQLEIRSFPTMDADVGFSEGSICLEFKVCGWRNSAKFLCSEQIALLNALVRAPKERTKTLCNTTLKF